MIMIMITLMMTALIISLLMMAICVTISKKMKNDREKMSPFECGFNPFNSARMPFSIQFFLIAVLFLIFDIEIAIIFPIMLTCKWMMSMEWILTITTFIVILLLGLIHEWKNGMLEWMWGNS
uniref:NADH-ubiquinone oxidoreductase chain 3 n=1 Tax=Urolabida menghaiensis TaxID=1603604 RepID=A0A2P1CM72_9HEMI|nr:NADH dehydrogenase subunit 3 [Urolabida menghaiensis]